MLDRCPFTWIQLSCSHPGSKQCQTVRIFEAVKHPTCRVRRERSSAEASKGSSPCVRFLSTLLGLHDLRALEGVGNLTRDEPGEFLATFTQWLIKLGGGADPGDSPPAGMELSYERPLGFSSRSTTRSPQNFM